MLLKSFTFKCFSLFQDKVSLDPELSLDWDQEMAASRPHDCVPLPSNHPLYVLYTSGTTGTPKVPAISYWFIIDFK